MELHFGPRVGEPWPSCSDRKKDMGTQSGCAFDCKRYRIILKNLALWLTSVTLLASYCPTDGDAMTKKQRDYYPDPRLSICSTQWMEAAHNGVLRSIAAQARCSLAKPDPDVHKLDYYVTHENWAVPFGVQLKSVLVDDSVFEGCELAYRVEVDLYDKLRACPMDAILLVQLLPKCGPWIEHVETHSELRNHMLWYSLAGLPPSNAGKPTIHIPFANVVTPEWLARVFERKSKRRLNFQECLR